MRRALDRGAGSNYRPHLLSVAPPYGNRAPAGTAYLLGYLEAHGCDDFDFLDLRLGAPFDFTPSYRTTGAFGESYALDLPDLPVVLMLIDAFERGASVVPERTPVFDRYCLERGISPAYLQSYLACLDRYFAASFDQIPRIDFIGFSVWTPNYLATLMAAAHLKRRPRPPVIVAGGPQVTASRAAAELGLRSGLFDVVALGEGEETLLDLYRAFRRGGGVPAGVAGTLTVDPATGGLRREERKLLRLEALPLPSFAEMPLQAYQADDSYRILPFQLSRGCTDRCSFCSEWVFWKHFRSDTAEHAVSQLAELQRRYGATFIEFTDSLLNGNPRRLVAFAEELLRRSIEIGWSAFMRAQITKEAAELIARAGCHGVFVGIESFSDEALELMNKRRTEAENIQAVITFVEAGIQVTAGFIPGFPGDSRRGFLHSVEVLRELQDRYPGRISLHEEPFTVMANAPIYHDLERMGLARIPFADDYLDIAPRHREAAASVLCSVEGDAQGMERLGRMKIVGVVKTDAPVRGAFEEGEDEALPLHGFDLRHAYGGWYAATLKSPAGHRYCVLVDEDELAELEQLQQELYPLQGSTDPRIAAFLDRIERAHCVPPSRPGPRLVRCLYRRGGAERCSFMASPFVVARDMGWRHGHRIMVMDTATGRPHRRPRAEGLILELCARKPRREAELWRHAAKRGAYGSRERVRAALDDLHEDGILVVYEAEAAAADVVAAAPVLRGRSLPLLGADPDKADTPVAAEE